MQMLRSEGGAEGIPEVGRGGRGLDVLLPKSPALPRLIREKNKERRRRSDQMSLDWDVAMPIHARSRGSLVLLTHPTSVSTVS